ncbi:MAG: hypothetical protein HDS99_00965 [Bacteroidales bacterium]|nr:hypothetical protein [Bacteroidales bacterium]
MTKLFLSFLLLLFSFTAFADDVTPPFPLGKDPVPPVKGDPKPGKGDRAPMAPIYCNIDFESLQVNITGYDSDNIEYFEILDANTSICYVSTTDCADFVTYLSNTENTLMVVFYFDGFKLSGYFSN